MNRATVAAIKKLPRSMSPAQVWVRSAQPLHGLVLPEQVFQLPQHSATHWTGARQLMLAVLEDAVACWFRYRHLHTKRDRRLFRETHNWFWSNDKSWLYAFENICTHLDLDPDCIRRGLCYARPRRLGQYGSVVRRQPVLSSRPCSAPGKLPQGGKHRARY